MAISTKVWAVAEVVAAADKNTYEQDNFSDLDTRKTGIYTGEYTGDGTTSLAITGVGFQPKYIHILEKQADNVSVVRAFTSDTIVDDDPQGGAILIDAAGVCSFLDNRILSLDADGFTVSDDSSNGPPNEDGQDYNFICFGG